MAAKKGKAKSKPRVVVIGNKHKKKRVSGTIGKTTHRRKKRKSGGFMGGTSKAGMKEIAIMAIGVGVGAGFTHIVLRPVEKKLTDKWPLAGKFLAAGEVLLGGFVALQSKGNFMKSLGIGVLAGGVHGLMKQLNVYKEIPKIMGTDAEYSEIRVPINGPLDKMLAGILEGKRDIYTKTVAGTDYTKTVAGNGMQQDYTKTVADTELEEEASYPVKGGW